MHFQQQLVQAAQYLSKVIDFLESSTGTGTIPQLALPAQTAMLNFMAPTQPVEGQFISDYLVESSVSITVSILAKYCMHIIAPTNILRHPLLARTKDTHLHLVHLAHK